MFEIMIGPIGPRKRPWWQRQPKVSLRTLGRAVAALQVAEGMAVHARRDDCFIHTLQAHAIRAQCVPVLPRRLVTDADWVHRHIEAPGMRIQARMEDEIAS